MSTLDSNKIYHFYLTVPIQSQTTTPVGKTVKLLLLLLLLLQLMSIIIVMDMSIMSECIDLKLDIMINTYMNSL